MTKATGKSSSKKSGVSNTEVTPEQRYKMIAEAAYYIAEKRGFGAGDLCLDWENAEEQVNTMLNEKV